MKSVHIAALLAAVATRDFVMLTDAFSKTRLERIKPPTKLKRALRAFVAYAQDYPARYRLLLIRELLRREALSKPRQWAHSLSSPPSFRSVRTPRRCLKCRNLELASLIYGSVHGLIDLQVGGRMRKEKGLKDEPAPETDRRDEVRYMCGIDSFKHCSWPIQYWGLKLEVLNKELGGQLRWECPSGFNSQVALQATADTLQSSEWPSKFVNL